MKDQLTQYLQDIGTAIGVEFYYVGGSVRDGLLGIAEPDDFDLVARGLPTADLMNALRPYGGVELTGTLFKVIRFHPKRKEFGQLDIALPRTEMSSGIGHSDWDVLTDHTLSIEQDLVRRDFSINALAENVQTGELIDPLNGRADLDAGILRAIHTQTFEEDPLRVIRAVRFIAKLGFDVEPDTHTQMVQHAHLLTHVSGERLQMEFLKLLTQPHVGKALHYLKDIGALPHFLPELEDMVGCEQNKYHSHDVWTHTVKVVENTESQDPYVVLAALLHDVGKPPTRWVGPDGEAHFYLPERGQEFLVPPQVPGAHEEVGASMAYRIMQRLRFSSSSATRVAALVREHMFARELSPRTARRFLARLDHVPGGLEDNARALFAIRVGDIKGGKTNAEGSRDAAEEFLQTAKSLKNVEAELAKQSAITVRDLKVNGHDLMELGLEGVEVGKTQKHLLNIVLDDPEENEKSILLRHAKMFKFMNAPSVLEK